MPILPAEPDRFPADLFDCLADESFRSDRRCWVLHTKPRQEKSIARQLLASKVPHYLPSIPRRSVIRGKTMTSFVPLFTSYVFLFGNQEERVVALGTNRLVSTLAVHDQVQVCSDLRQIDRLIASGSDVEPEILLEPGTPVEITTGPLAGLRGMIIKSSSHRRFVVKVDFIHQGASVTLEECSLIPLRKEALAS